MPKKRPVGRPKHKTKNPKLTVYVKPKTIKKLKADLAKMPPKPKATKGMVIDQWAENDLLFQKTKEKR